MIVLDAGPIVAAADRNDRHHDAAARFLRSTSEPIFISPFVLAETDYLIWKDTGVPGELALLQSVIDGAVRLEPFDHGDVAACARLIERYRTLEIGLADASVVVLAERLGTNRIATFDRRHFGAMRTSDGRVFELLP